MWYRDRESPRDHPEVSPNSNICDMHLLFYTEDILCQFNSIPLFYLLVRHGYSILKSDTINMSYVDDGLVLKKNMVNI